MASPVSRLVWLLSDGSTPVCFRGDISGVKVHLETLSVYDEPLSPNIREKIINMARHRPNVPTFAAHLVQILGDEYHQKDGAFLNAVVYPVIEAIVVEDHQARVTESA